MDFPFLLCVCLSVDVAQLMIRWLDFVYVASHISRRYNPSKLPNLCGGCWSAPSQGFLRPVSSATEIYLLHHLGTQRLILIFVRCLNIFWICGELKMSEKKDKSQSLYKLLLYYHKIGKIASCKELKNFLFLKIKI